MNASCFGYRAPISRLTSPPALFFGLPLGGIPDTSQTKKTDRCAPAQPSASMGSYFSSFTGCASPHFRQYGATPAPCASSETHPIFDQVTGHKIHGQRTTAFSFEIFGLASTAGHPLFCSPPLGFAGVLNTTYTRSKAPACFSATHRRGGVVCLSLRLPRPHAGRSDRPNKPRAGPLSTCTTRVHLRLPVGLPNPETIVPQQLPELCVLNKNIILSSSPRNCRTTH